MTAVYEHSLTVVAAEIDGLGHVNNLVYLRWLQDAAVAHSAHQGWDSAAYRSLGLAWVARSHFIEYLAPARCDDAVIVRTWVADMKRVTSLRKYQILRAGDGQLLAQAQTNWAFVEISTHRLRRIPPEIADAFEVIVL